MPSKQIAWKRFCRVAARNRFQSLGHVREGHWANSLKGLWLFLAFHEVEQVRIKQTTCFCKTMSLSFSIALVFLFHVWPPSSGLQVHHWQSVYFCPHIILFTNLFVLLNTEKGYFWKGQRAQPMLCWLPNPTVHLNQPDVFSDFALYPMSLILIISQGFFFETGC